MKTKEIELLTVQFHPKILNFLVLVWFMILTWSKSCDFMYFALNCPVNQSLVHFSFYFFFFFFLPQLLLCPDQAALLNSNVKPGSRGTTGSKRINGVFRHWWEAKEIAILTMRFCCNLVNWVYIKSLGPSDAIWHWRSWSRLVQVMACCLTAPSHYLNQCWLIISKVLWHSSEDIIIRNFEDTNQ